MTTISPIKYEVEIHEPLSTPVPMPPSILSSEALVIWMFRIAMNAPIIAAITEIQTVAPARAGTAVGVTATAPAPRGVLGEVERARSDMASPLVALALSLTSFLRCEQRDAGVRAGM